MKLVTISLLSATIAILLCWSALKTAQSIAEFQLKQQTQTETTP